MEFNDELGIYTFEVDGITFSWEEEPQEDYQNKTKVIATNYKKNLPKIIDFILPDLKEVYGEIGIDEIKNKLGKPVIDIENGQVTYCEQSFDDIHIFSFEFLDDKFEELQYFAIDG